MNVGQQYREAAARGANPVRLVILLYEQAIEDLRRAITAHSRGDIEGRTREINHALLVIGYLQATLDKEKGATVAAHLEDFYNQVRASLIKAQCAQSSALIEQQISCLMQVSEAWRQVELESAPTSAAPQPTQPQEEHAAHASTEWKA